MIEIEETLGNQAIIPEEVGIVKQKMLEVLEQDPWNKTALSTLSEIEYGDSSRLYRLDALKSDPSDIKAASNHLVWETYEETMGSGKADVNRLASRFSAVISIADNVQGGESYPTADMIEDALLKMKDKGKIRELIVGLKASFLLEVNHPGVIANLLPKQITGIKTVITELLRLKEDSLPEGFTYRLLKAATENQYLFTDLKIRQTISEKIFQLGDNELAFWLAMKSIEINPQDSRSSIVALNAAINMGDDQKTLSAAGVALSLKSEPKGIRYEKIAAAAIRTGRIGYAKDLLLRRRMKLNLEGHRQRIGIYYHEGNYQRLEEEIERTPLPHRNNDAIKSYHTLALAAQGEIDSAIKSIDEVADPLEKDLLRYYCYHLSGNYNQAEWSLNAHYSKMGMGIIGDSWKDGDCKFHDIEVTGVKKSRESYGLVSVIMTCHRYNDFLQIAIDSVIGQSYPEVQFIFVDDCSPDEDVGKYDGMLEGIEVTRIRMPKNSGTYACRNAGLKLAKGDYITFADSDDWIHPEKISNSLDFLIGNNADLVCGRYIRMGVNGGIQWNGVRFARFALMGMTFRAAVLKERLRGFDERMRHSADSELFERARVLLGERKVLRYPTVEVVALESGSNLTSEGDLAIDWIGTSGDRVKYSEAFRRWHSQLGRSKIKNTTDRFFDFPHDEKSLTENEVELRGCFEYVEVAAAGDSDPTGLKDPILVTMCTYPGGFATVVEAVESLLYGQTRTVSELRLTVNGGNSPEGLPEDERLTVILSEVDVTDKGKFIQIGSHDGYVITADDDIFYPTDYVERMLEHVDRFDRGCLIGVHGAHIPEGPPIIRWWEYMNYRRSHVFSQEMPTFVPVNVIGTGTLAFHTTIGVPNHNEFDYQRMVDLHLAVWAQRNHIPMRICPRRRGWLAEIDSGYAGTIWDSAKDDNSLQHRMLEVLQRQNRWTLHGSRPWGEFASSGVFGEFGNWPNRELCPGLVLPVNSGSWPKMKKNPRVTIYMPAYNCEDYVVESVRSALNQTYPNIEVCVHNDGSTDKTLSVLKRAFRFNRRVKISTSPNRGIGYASNRAIKKGRGSLILQLDADDVVHPTALEKLVSEVSEGIVCAYGSFNRIGVTGEKIDDGWNWPTYSHPRLMRSMIIHHPRLFRRDAWLTVGGFNEELTNAVDYDFFLRLAEVGQMKHTSEKLYSYRIHEMSTSQEKYDLQTRNTLIVQRSALRRMGLDNYVNYAPNPSFPRRLHYINPAFLNN